MNIKKIVASFLAAAMVTSSLAIGSFAANIGVAEGTLDEETGLLYVPLDDGTLKVTYPDGATLEGDIVIPETFGDGDDAKTVTEMDGNIMSCYGVTAVSIPKSVTRFSYPYFGSSADLREITVDEENQFFTSVDGVLFNKEKTEIIKYPPKKGDKSYSIPSTVTIVRERCFDNGEMEVIVIPNSVKRLESVAFSGCHNLTELNIPSSVEAIIGSPVPASGVTAITVAPENTYYSSVDGVLYTADLKTLVAYPPASQANEYLVPNGTEIIEEHAFDSAKNLSSVIIPDSVTIIGAWAFAGCDNLVSIEIPSKVTKLEGTFMNCYSLETVTLPLGLKTIGYCAFQMFVFEYDGIQYTPTPSFKTINYAGIQEDWDKIEIGFGNDILNKATIYFSDGTTGGATGSTEDVVQEPEVTENENGTKDFTPGVKKNATTSDSDIETMKSITANAPAEAFDEGVVLNVSHDTFSGSGNSFAVDISFVNSETNEKVQPKEGTSVTVKIPVPENLKNSDPLFVYHINDNGKAEKVEAETETIAGVKYMVFKATHFSTYVLSDNPNAADNTTGGNTSGSTDGNTGGTTSTPSTPADTTPSAPSASTSTPAASDTTNGEPTSSETTSSEPVSSDNTTSSAPSASDSNPTTGVAMSALPLLAAVSAVIVIKKKK